MVGLTTVGALVHRTGLWSSWLPSPTSYRSYQLLVGGATSWHSWLQGLGSPGAGAGPLLGEAGSWQFWLQARGVPGQLAARPSESWGLCQPTGVWCRDLACWLWGLGLPVLVLAC